MLRTNTCGELTMKNKGDSVSLCGWNQSRRDHGGIIFIDLRDRYGLTQIVFDPKSNKEVHKIAEKLRREDCIKIIGKVRHRGKDLENPNLKTGEIEVLVNELEILNSSETPPIEIDDRKEAGDETRLEYRYLDLRRPKMQKHLAIRHKALTAARQFLNKDNFLEIETPMLIRATPEGARDYIVPSRVHPGSFYSLPQSPQLYKQLLMVSGMDKYYQIARCLRDEDLRADRQPEFTQIDIEMSFVDEEDVYKLCEGLIKDVWKRAIGVDIKTPFPRLTYEDVMSRFGSDKPDMRFDLELIDVSDIVKKSEFSVFKNADQIKCINPNKEIPRKELDKYIEFCQKSGAKGMAWARVTDKGLESSIAKFLSPSIQKSIIKTTKAKPGSTLMFIADKPLVVAEVLGRLRLKLGADLDLIDKKAWKFLIVTDFPLFEWNEDHETWSPMHHIFSMPQEDKMKFLKSDPGKVTGKLYDVALNGTELGGGSIRIHKRDIQEKVLDVIGMNYDQAEARFGFLLKAFKYGAPPHGGIAFGFDRICALLCGFNDIREVIAFPKNKDAASPMDGCPTPVDAIQLKELHVKTDVVKKKQ
jgi:aspartyl-tRNA synthetase